MGCCPTWVLCSILIERNPAGQDLQESETGFEIDVRGVWTGFQLIPPWERQSQLSFAPLFLS